MKGYHHTHTRTAHGGFTLIELMIGITLLGFILVLLFAGFRIATNTWNALETKIQKSADEQAGLKVVDRLIGSVIPLHWQRAPSQPLTFNGQSSRLTLIAPLTELTGPQVVEFAIERQDDSNTPEASLQLVLRHSDLQYQTTNFSAGIADKKPHALIRNLRTAAFSYFGILVPGEPPRWNDDWTALNQLPKLVRIHLVTQDSIPTTLVVATQVSGDRVSSLRAVFGQE